MTDENQEDSLEMTGADLLHAAAREVASLVPGIGPILFEMLFQSPIERRRDKWLLGMKSVLDRIESGQILVNEQFTSAFYQAYRYAMVNHNEENITALRNAVLNSLPPATPDEIKQKMFIHWAGEMTAWHIRFLRLFSEEESRIPALNLSDPKWQWNLAVHDLADIIEEKYPETRDNFESVLQVITDLSARNLLTNYLPGRLPSQIESDSKALLGEVRHEPTLSPIAKEFLTFITAPRET